MDGGHVVLDSSGMLHEPILAYWTSQCEKKKEARIVTARRTTGLKPKTDRGFQGDKRVDRIRYLLENGFVDDQGKKIIRSREQRMIHETYIRTCLPKIYQSEWEDAQERILIQYGLEKLQQEALVVMPRRSGKTWSMAMFCGVMLISCADIEISIFATGQRTASKLLKLIDKFLGKLFAFIGHDEFKILQKNKEQIVLIGPDGTERICGCYPGSVTVKSYFLLGGGSVCTGRESRSVGSLRMHTTK